MTVYRLPIRLPAKSARSSPSLKGRVCAPGTFQQLVESLVFLTHKQSVCTGYLPASPISFFCQRSDFLSASFLCLRGLASSPNIALFLPWGAASSFFSFFFFSQRKCVRQESNPRLTFVTVYRVPIRLLTFVTVYRLPIRLPDKSALTFPVV